MDDRKNSQIEYSGSWFIQIRYVSAYSDDNEFGPWSDLPQGVYDKNRVTIDYDTTMLPVPLDIAIKRVTELQKELGKKAWETIQYRLLNMETRDTIPAELFT